MKSSLRYSPFILMSMAAVAIAVATVVEDACGTACAHRLVYGAWWFRLLWLAVTVSALRLVVRRRLWRRPAVMGLHASFAIILTGALLTSLTGRKGMLHLRKGIPTAGYVSTEDGRPGAVRKLPFPVRLDDFYIHYYPGTGAPMDYVSQINIGGRPFTVSMNRIAGHRHYRFYQSSYDKDMQGSVLSVNYDPWGIPVTYLGYALLALSVCWLTARPLFRRGREGRGRALPLLAMLALLPAQRTFAAGGTGTLPAGRMNGNMERMQVIFCDRKVPFGAMSHEFLLKVYGSDTYRGLDASRVVSGIILDPVRWSHEHIIRVGRGDYRALIDYVNPDDGTLRSLGKNSREDEKVALMVMLMQGTLFKALPPDVEPLPPLRVEAELLYHRVDWTLWAIILVAASIVLVTLAGRLWPVRAAAASAASGVTALFLLFLWALRWYISGHIPLSNGFETLIFVALCMQAVSLFSPRLFYVSSGASALLLVVAHMGAMNPHITPLMPVLHSPWLSAHVSVIMVSYSLLVLSIASRLLLRPAVCLLALGIFLGAVWANVSWGTYWSWDPKESWALVTMLVYSIPLHCESLPWFRSLRNYRIYSVLALACLLMTYFGVNYLLGGMHSYAG